MAAKLQIKLLYVGRTSFTGVFGAGKHSHTHLELIGVSGGKYDLSYCGKKFKIKSPAVVLYGQNKVHREKLSPGGTCDMFYAGVVIKNSPPALSGALKSDSPVMISGEKARRVMKDISEMLSEYTSRELGWEIAAAGSLSKCIRKLVPLSDKKETVTSAGSERAGVIAGKIKEYIEANFKNKISLKELAGKVYLSPYYLSHVFKDETGYSPVQYAIKMKLEYAKALLRDEDLKISEIAQTIGYESLHHFTRIFTLVEGMTPGRYRKSRRYKVA